jgi:ATP-binding cassette subfamily F protein 3
VKRLTHDVGFSDEDLERQVATLSGGERGRLELAKVLVRQPDLLLMDEPTNHLDLAAIERLEAYLVGVPGRLRAGLARPHLHPPDLPRDRRARGRQVREVPRSATRSTWSSATRASSGPARSTSGRRSTSTRPRPSSARTSPARPPSRRRAGARCWRSWSGWSGPEDHWELAGKISLKFSTGGELGSKEILRAPEISVGYPGKPILRGVTVNVYRGDRVGIVGPNGAGKSTLLKTLIGELPPLEGEVQRGTGVRLGYFDQKLGSLDEERSLVEEIQSVRADLSPEVVRQYLAKFRFFEDDPFRSVRGLSGGERSRLAMAKMMLFPRNVLALDEPTNHLDIPARETLEEALREFEGTLVVVSHDRYFLDRICTRLLVIEGEALEAHLGNWSDYRARQREQAKEQAKAPALPRPRRRPRRPRPRRRPARPTRSGSGTGAGSSARWRRWRRRWASWRQSWPPCGRSWPAITRGDWQKLHTLADRERELGERLAKRMAEWEAAGRPAGRAACRKVGPPPPDRPQARGRRVRVSLVFPIALAALDARSACGGRHRDAN